MSNMDKPIEISDTFQQYIIQGILTDPSVFIRAQKILKPEFFDNTPVHSFRRCVSFFHDLYQKFGTLCDIDLINIALREKNPQEVPLQKVQGWNTIDDSERLLKQIEQYCKHKACVLAATEVYNQVQKGETASAVKTLEDAVMLKLPTNFGVNVFSSPDEIIKELQELHSTQYELKTGWNEVDKALSGGFGYGEVEVFCAPSGMGKSLALANLGLNYAKQGLNVLLFSLELNELLTKKRILSMLTGFPIRTMKGNESEVAMTYTEAMEKIGWDNIGYFNILQIPNGSNTMDIETILNEFEIKTGKIVNVIIVDYADLMSPMQKVSRDNIHLTEKFIYEELRDLSVKRTKLGKKSVILTASQLGKGSLSQDIAEWTQDSLSGSAGKNYTCDNLISIYANNSMKEQGIMKMKFLKTRNSAYTKDIELKYNIDTLRIDNIDTTTSNVSQLDNALIQDMSPTNDSNKIAQTILNPVLK